MDSDSLDGGDVWFEWFIGVPSFGEKPPDFIRQRLSVCRKWRSESTGELSFTPSPAVFGGISAYLCLFFI